jgi:hypothetical protein
VDDVCRVGGCWAGLCYLCAVGLASVITIRRRNSPLRNRSP